MPNLWDLFNLVNNQDKDKKEKKKEEENKKIGGNPSNSL